MFGRKYVFESRSTRFKRLFIGGASIASLALALTITFIVYIPIYARMQKGRSTGAFFQKSPDAIAVFTGDKGRIGYALEVLKRNPSSKLLISGVHAANSFQTLINLQGKEANELEGTDSQVDLDYESKNTFENVLETVNFMRANPQLNNVLIISSDYHIMRVNLIISHLMSNAETTVYFDSVINRYDNWDGMRKLLKEAVKIARTFFILKVLREDVVPEV